MGKNLAPDAPSFVRCLVFTSSCLLVTTLFAFSVSSALLLCLQEVSDSEINVHFRLLQKKDPTTRMKALDALRVLFSSRSSQQLESLLPVWVHIMNRLSVDNDRSVREKLFLAFMQIVQSVKRGLASFLKDLFPAWFIAQSDPCREVAAEG